MAKKFLVNIDLVKNQILNAVLHIVAGTPSTPAEGQFWYDSNDNRLKYHDGSSALIPWVTGTDIPDGAIANTKLTTNPLARANHTGTQLAATISDLATAVAAISVGGDLTGTVSNAQIGTGVIVNADINASAAIALSKLATDPLARANHTGTQAHTTISDFDAGVQTNRLDQMAAPTANVSFNNQKITNLATPTADSDAATKLYVDQAVAGLSWKEAVRAATTANITLSGAQSIDGVSVIAGDRVLVKNQSTASGNGIYVAAAGAWTRATDADSQDDLLGAAVMVQEGSTLSGTQWVLTTDAPITVGTTGLTFTQFGGGTAYVAGDGLTLSGSTFNVGSGTGISVGADSISIDTAVVARKYSASVGNGSATSIAVTHSFGTRDVVVNVYDNASYDTIECDVVRTDTNTVTVTFSTAPASNAYRVVVIG